MNHHVEPSCALTSFEKEIQSALLSVQLGVADDISLVPKHIVIG